MENEIFKYRVMVKNKVVDTHTRGTRALRHARELKDFGFNDVTIEVYTGWGRK